MKTRMDNMYSVEHNAKMDLPRNIYRYMFISILKKLLET